MVFYVLCPFRVTSGGPELLHQLVAALNSLNYEAYITYMCTRQDFDDVDTVIPAEYQMYVTDFRLIGDIVDEKDSVIVFPETLSYLLPHYKNAQKVFWWLSVGNYFLQENLGYNISQEGVLLGIIDWLYCNFRCFQGKRKHYLNLSSFPDDIIHLVQSRYAADYLEANHINEYRYLTDFVNDEFIGKCEPGGGRDLIL